MIKVKQREKGGLLKQKPSSSMQGGGATAEAAARDRKRETVGVKPAEEEDGGGGGVKPVDVVEGSKHRDGSIYRADAHPLHELFHLADTRETRLKPMRLSDPTPDCYPCWTACIARTLYAGGEVWSSPEL